jgi:hypothetical protein
LSKDIRQNETWGAATASKAAAEMATGRFCDRFGSDQALRHTALDDALEQTAKRIALAKGAMSVLGEGRVIRNLAVRSKPTEPAVRQVEMDLFGKRLSTSTARSSTGG